MKFTTLFLSYDIRDIAAHARAAEDLGFSGVWLSETNSDPFLSLALAAEHTQNVTLGTAIAVAFPRSPATLAYIAWDLAKLSGGRFSLGLGTQVRAHIERRFGVKWEKPVTKMRETILAMRAFWDTWQHGTPLKFEGEFFNLNLMTPFFAPSGVDGLDLSRIPVYVAAVNENMLQLSGEVCDGVFIHSINTVKYLREFAHPNIEAGMKESGRSKEGFTVASGLFVIPTDDPDEAARAEAYIRQQISFYMSTPAYRVVAELHGWEEIVHTLSKMARKGEWAAMPAMVSDDMMHEMTVSGPWAQLPRLIHDKYDGLLDEVNYYLPFLPGQNDEGWKATIEGFKAL